MNTINSEIRELKAKQSEIISRGKIIDRKTHQLVRSEEDLKELEAVRKELNEKKSEKRFSLNEAKKTKRRAKVEAKTEARRRKNVLTKLFKAKKNKN